MKRNSEMIDGITSETWKEIERISTFYPKEIKFAQGTQAKIALLKFYHNKINGQIYFRLG